MTSVKAEPYFYVDPDSQDAPSASERELQGAAEKDVNQAGESSAESDEASDSEHPPAEDNIFWVYVEELKKGD